jgi:hypothetical protein
LVGEFKTATGTFRQIFRHVYEPRGRIFRKGLFTRARAAAKSIVFATEPIPRLIKFTMDKALNCPALIPRCFQYTKAEVESDSVVPTT